MVIGFWRGWEREICVMVFLMPLVHTRWRWVMEWERAVSYCVTECIVGVCRRSAIWNWLTLWSSLYEPNIQRVKSFLVRVVPCMVLLCQVSGRRLMGSANLVSVHVSRSFVRVAAVRWGIVVSIFVLALRFRDMFGVPPPMSCWRV